MSTGILPKQTIYVKNLYEKIGVTELKKCLYTLFAQFGQIAEVQAVKTNKLRGQAWIIFADVASATNALQCMQGFPLFDKPIDIQYAKDESTALKKHIDGWKSRKKQKREKAAAAQGARDAVPEAAGGDAAMADGGVEAAGSAAGTAAPARAAVPENPPNKLLLFENLPATATANMLELVCKQIPGLVEVRMVEAKPGLAFVEYDAEPSASQAMQSLQGFRISQGHDLRITYAK